MSRFTKVLTYAGACGALALGGAALAGAAGNDNSSGSSSSSAAQRAHPPGGYGPAPAGAHDRGGHGGRHVGPNGQREKALTGDVAAKVKAAAQDEVSGGTVERVKTDADTSSPYEAHVRKADGSEVVVYVDKAFEVTSVDAMQRP